MGAGKVVATFNSAAKESTNTVLHTIIPFMGFVSLLIGIIQGSGFGNWFAKLLQPLCGNIIGLVIDVYKRQDLYTVMLYSISSKE